MNRPVQQLRFPRLPVGASARAYDNNLEKNLKSWATAVTAQMNSQTQSVGAVLKSTGTVALTNPIHHVSGTQAIATLTAPSGFTGPVWLIADGLWTTITTGNISQAITAVVGYSYQFIFDGSIWYPR